MEELMKKIRIFNRERDWDQFHSSANLAKSIVIEAAELLEHFQWQEESQDLQGVREELADVMIYCLQLADHLHLDPETIIREKMALNARKYPVDKCRGSSAKYDEL